MERTDEQIDMFLDFIGIELLSYQREMLRHYLKSDRNLILPYPPRARYADLMIQMQIFNELFNTK